MNQKYFFSLLATVFVVTVSPVKAQQVEKVRRVGLLGTQSARQASARLNGLQQGLRDLGYTEGKDIAIEYRWADGVNDRVPGLAAELVRVKVDAIIIARGTPAIQAARRATSTIPIIFVGSSDPVALGLVGSLAQPGGNVTDLSLGGPELYGKRLELLKRTIPKASRVAVLCDPANSSTSLSLKEVRASAKVLGVQIQVLDGQVPDELKNAFDLATRTGAGALVVLQQPTITTHRNLVVDLAAKNRLPAIYADTEWPSAGGLMSYGANFTALYRRAAVYVDKILKGAKPADLPVEQPTKFELVINLKAAKQIGLTIPQSVLYRADKVIK
jgi:putative ABC transport system substrate-binding protein